jgi:hypothetical protein
MIAVTGRILVALTGVAALVACATQPTAPASWDGLEKREVKGIDAVYVRPNVTFPHYKKVILDPVQVSFSKDWTSQNSTEYYRRLDSQDIQRIKDALAQLFRERFIRELNDGGYQVTDTADDATIRVIPAIVDLYINAPDIQTAGMSRTYTTNAGAMSLNMEVHDGPTGQLIARVVDRQRAMDTGRLQWTTSVTNTADAQRAIDVWAKQLRAGLDRVNGAAKP